MMTNNGAKTSAAQSPITLPLYKLKKRWGKDIVQMRFVSVPVYLFRLQSHFGLRSTEFVVLFYLLSAWKEDDVPPRVAHGDLAAHMGMSEKTVRRALEVLEGKGLISRQSRYDHIGGQRENAYDLSGLVNKLTSIARVQIGIWADLTMPF